MLKVAAAVGREHPDPPNIQSFVDDLIRNHWSHGSCIACNEVECTPFNLFSLHRHEKRLFNGQEQTIAVSLFPSCESWKQKWPRHAGL